MNVLVVEDNRIQCDNLSKMIEKNFFDIRVYKAFSYNEALEYINNKEIDLFFLDVNIGKYSGIQLAEKIREFEQHKLTGIIFITVEFMYIAEAVKKAHCYDYIIKPYKEKEIKKIIETFASNIETKEIKCGKYTFIDIDSNISVKIERKDIIFIKSKNKKCEIHTVKGVFITRRIALIQLLNEIKDENIIQSHKAFAINISYINRIEKCYEKLWKVILNGLNDEILLSNTYREKVLEKVKVRDVNKCG